VDITSNPDSFSFQYGGRSFNFHDNWVTVQPSQHVSNINAATEFVDNDMFLTHVAIPELTARIFRVRVKTAFCQALRDFPAPVEPNNRQLVAQLQEVGDDLQRFV